MGSLVPPDLLHDLRCVDDVPQSEHDPRASATMSPQLAERGQQLAHGAVRHVVHQQQVRPIAAGQGQQHLPPHVVRLVEREGRADRHPLPGALLDDRRELDEVLVGSVRKNLPSGESVTIRIDALGSARVSAAAIEVVRRRCPSPRPSWEYSMTRHGSRRARPAGRLIVFLSEAAHSAGRADCSGEVPLPSRRGGGAKRSRAKPRSPRAMLGDDA